MMISVMLSACEQTERGFQPLRHHRQPCTTAMHRGNYELVAETLPTFMCVSSSRHRCCVKEVVNWYSVRYVEPKTGRTRSRPDTGAARRGRTPSAARAGIIDMYIVVGMLACV